jgi:AcrR family transcriptional regulator
MRAGATREDVLDAARSRYVDGERIDMRAIAADLGVGRATLYRWFGSRQELLGEVIARETEGYFAHVRARVGGRGAPALLETFDRINRGLVRATGLRRYVEQEREAALRTLTSSAGRVQPAAVKAVAAMIEAEAASGAYRPPTDPATLAYAIVRLTEAFIYNDALAGIRGDVEDRKSVV